MKHVRLEEEKRRSSDQGYQPVLERHKGIVPLAFVCDVDHIPLDKHYQDIVEDVDNLPVMLWD